MELFWNSTHNHSTNALPESTDPAALIPNFVMRSTVTLVTIGCLSFVGTVGNSLFILCFLLEKNLRSISNYLITLLALADIMACLGFNLVYIMMVNRLSSVNSCWYWLSTIPLSPIISMFSQFLISIDRTVLVTHSIATYKKWFNKKLCSIYALGGWSCHVIYIVLSITIPRPPTVPGLHICGSLKSLRPTRELTLYTLNGFSILYFGMACVCYGRLIYYVRQRRVPLTSTKQTYVRTSMTLFMLCIFSVTTTLLSPILVYLSLSISKNPREFAILDQVGTVSFCLGFAINPFLYGYRIKMFRYKLKSLFMFYLTRRVDPVQDIG